MKCGHTARSVRSFVRYALGIGRWKEGRGGGVNIRKWDRRKNSRRFLMPRPQKIDVGNEISRLSFHFETTNWGKRILAEENINWFWLVTVSHLADITTFCSVNVDTIVMTCTNVSRFTSFTFLARRDGPLECNLAGCSCRGRRGKKLSKFRPYFPRAFSLSSDDGRLPFRSKENSLAIWPEPPRPTQELHAPAALYREHNEKRDMCCKFRLNSRSTKPQDQSA